MNKNKHWLCRIFGHIPIRINYKTFTATSFRCKKKLQVSYDMCYGSTIVEREKK